ncbi:MAG: hypothetical protein WAV04_00280 [Candidatus Microsaccharimonas sp.]
MGKVHQRFILVSRRIAIILILLLATIVGPLLNDQEAAAIFHRGTDYFSGASPRYLGYNECNIKSDGYHGGASHNNFINAVREAESRPYNAYNCYGLDAIGARYVVHTMLGRGVQYNAGKKWERISAADWAEFDRRVRTTTMSVEARQYNANGCLGSAISFNREDVNQYFEPNCNNTYTAVVFRVNGSIVYIVDTRCMNPVGDYSGPPSVDFNLNPSITSNSSSISEGGGSTVNLTPTVNNTGATASTNAQWQVNTFRVNPGLPVPGAGENGSTPQAHYGNGATSIANGTGVFQRGVSPPLPVGPQTLGDYPVGTRICYALSVQPATQSNGNWRHSTPFCVTIAKKPKVQVLGGDLWVGKGGVSNVQTSTSTKTISSESRIFGSWGEYGLVVSGSIAGMASGAGYSGGSTATSAFCDVSFLSFTNTGTNTTCNASTPKGGYRTQQQLPDISSRLIARTPLGANPTWNVAAAQSDVYSATGTVSLTSSGPIGKGKWVIINAPTATVIIRDNIVYTGETLTTIDNIPQVVIIADQIRIEGDVTQVDAWLIASGTTGNIVTCTDVANVTQLNAGNCSNRLTVNGPVMARHLYLYRTAGSGTGASSGAPAEVFNLRPDAYLWATAYSATAGRLQTIMTTELPPRF